MVELLSAQKFLQINSTALFSPKFTPTDDLDNSVLTRGASYNYLLSELTDYHKSSESLSKYKEELDSLLNDQTNLLSRVATDKFVGASLWSDELSLLERVIRDGESTAWKYGESGIYNYE